MTRWAVAALVVFSALLHSGASLATTARAAAAVTAPAPVTDSMQRAEPGMSADAAAVYAATGPMMRDLVGNGVPQRMLELLVPIVRRERHPLLVGRLVVAAAAVASGADGEQAVERLLRTAAAAPADPIAAFTAGVAVHYRGHVRGQSRAAKTADYRRAIALLEPLREQLASSPRLWIYLAVSYLRTGRQADAEVAIERAVATDDGGDADVYYCRAEVHQHKNPARALTDIERYIAIMQRNVQHGAWSAPDKERKVRAMRAHMKAVVAGSAKPGGLELFDPVREPRHDDWLHTAVALGWWLVGSAALLVALGWLRRFGRRSARP